MTVDALRNYGLVEMTEGEVRRFLASRSVGILGLPDEEGPYMVPLSFEYDGDRRCYFTFVLGRDSQKRRLSDRADWATFLVYSMESQYTWRSVMLTGHVHAVADVARPVVDEYPEPARRPSIIETAADAEDTAIHEFRIEEFSGIKYADVPPGFARPGVSDAE